MTPKILFLGGTHPRHLYYANEIHKRFPLAGAVLENRGGMYPDPPSNVGVVLNTWWANHFVNRMAAEEKYFGDPVIPPLENRTVYTAQNISNKMTVAYIKDINPDIALIFGCGMIKGELAQALPQLSINLHLGLSPRSRGAATLFWPFYFLEPQWAGCTFHKIVDEPDAGDILHQCVPELERGDHIHDVAAKAVIQATEDMIRLLGMFDLRRYRQAESDDWCRPYDWRWKAQSTTGKNFLSRDFQPSHLRMIYETYNDDIVDQYLDGNLKQHKPRLVRQF